MQFSDYKQLVRLLDQLIDEVGEDETHPLAKLMDVVGVLIERYEDEHVVGLGQGSNTQLRAYEVECFARNSRIAFVNS